jgi:muramoyltetrapeptide carboxypeptidase
MIKANRLKKGDLIGVIALSHPLKEWVLDIIKNGSKRLQDLGYKTIMGKTIGLHNGKTTGTIEERTKDFMDMITNKNIKAIFFAWGGEYANEILPFINWNQVKENPKIIMGHSDPTGILNAITQKTELITFYGHMASSFDPNWKWFKEYDLNAFNNILVNPKNNYIIIPSTKRETYVKGKGKGKIVGGCITDLIKLIGTKFMPNFNNKILILESYNLTIEELDDFIEIIEKEKIFNDLNGILLGKFLITNGNSEQVKELFINKLKKYSIPVLKTEDFGHNSHMTPIPIGAEIELDASNKKVIIINKTTS